MAHVLCTGSTFTDARTSQPIPLSVSQVALGVYMLRSTHAQLGHACHGNPSRSGEVVVYPSIQTGNQKS